MPNVDVPCGAPQCWVALVLVTVTVQIVGLPSATEVGLHATTAPVLSLTTATLKSGLFLGWLAHNEGSEEV